MGMEMGMGMRTLSYPLPLFSSAPILNPFPSPRRTFSVLQAASANANANADADGNSPYPRAHDFDPELRSVLELATDTELSEIENILFGPRSHSTHYFHAVQFS